MDLYTQLGFPAFSYTLTEIKRSVFQELHHLGIIFVEAQGVVLKRGLPGGDLIVGAVTQGIEDGRPALDAKLVVA